MVSKQSPSAVWSLGTRLKVLQERQTLYWTIGQGDLTEEELLAAVTKLGASGAGIDDAYWSEVIIMLVVICVHMCGELAEQDGRQRINLAAWTYLLQKQDQPFI